MGFIIRIFFCFCFGIITGCTISLPQKSQLKNLKPVPPIEYSIKHNLKHHPVFSEGAWPQKKWWLIYQSSELNSLIAETLANNPSLQNIRSRIITAKQDAIVTGSTLFPLVFFDATDTQQYLSKNGLYRAFNPKLPLHTTLVDLSLSFNYEFDFWGQNRNLFAEAIGKANAETAEAAEVELIITTALSQAYFAYKTNLSRKQLFEELVDVRQKAFNLHHLILRKGLSSELPSLLASENVLEAKKLLAQINEELDHNQYLINILAGRAPNHRLVINNKLPQLPRKLLIPKAISLDLAARRPDLMAQIWRAKAAAYKTGAAMAEYYPNINVVALIGLQSIAWAKLLNNSSATAAIKPAIHLPIFTAGAIRASIKASKAGFDAAIFAYNNLLLQSTQEILDVLVFAQTVYQQKTEQTEITHHAEQRYRLIHLRQQKGLDSDFAVFDLREEVIQKKLINITLLYNQYLASIKLIKALGGGYHQTEVPLVRKT